MCLDAEREKISHICLVKYWRSRQCILYSQSSNSGTICQRHKIINGMSQIHRLPYTLARAHTHINIISTSFIIFAFFVAEAIMRKIIFRVCLCLRLAIYIRLFVIKFSFLLNILLHLFISRFVSCTQTVSFFSFVKIYVSLLVWKLDWSLQKNENEFTKAATHDDDNNNSDDLLQSTPDGYNATNANSDGAFPDTRSR